MRADLSDVAPCSSKLQIIALAKSEPLPLMCHRSRHGHTTDSRLGTSIGLLPLNGVESLWTLLLFSVFREPRPTEMGSLPRYS